ncbi:hypothetical protein MHYP_G00317200 [Metynnis hypsauchen]
MIQWYQHAGVQSDVCPASLSLNGCVRTKPESSRKRNPSRPLCQENEGCCTKKRRQIRAGVTRHADSSCLLRASFPLFNRAAVSSLQPPRWSSGSVCVSRVYRGFAASDPSPPPPPSACQGGERGEEGKGVHRRPEPEHGPPDRVEGREEPAGLEPRSRGRGGERAAPRREGRN